MPRPPSRADVAAGRREPDGQPRGVDPAVPPRRRAIRRPSPTADAGRDRAASAGGRRQPAPARRCCRPMDTLLYGTLPARCRHGLRLYWWRSASPLLSDASDWRAPAHAEPLNSRGVPPTVSSTATNTVPKILIVGGGYAGFYTAWKLEKQLRKGEAEVTIVDPLPYMTYQPFLPEVAAGSIEARHAVVALRRHLKRTTVIAAKVTGINHANKVATITPERRRAVRAGVRPDRRHGRRRVAHLPDPRHRRQRDRPQDDRRGRRDPRPPHVELRQGRRCSLPAPSATVCSPSSSSAAASPASRCSPSCARSRRRSSRATRSSRSTTRTSTSSRRWAASCPRCRSRRASGCSKDLAKRGAYVHLDTQVTGAVDGNVELSTGEVIPTDLIIWTAGVMANPTVVRGGDLPVEERGRIRTRADLRVGTEEEIVEGAWAAGDVSAVPDLSGGGVGGYCVPNAQHAVRQAKLLAKNLVAVLRGELPARVLPQEPRRRRRPRPLQRRLPVGQHRAQGLHRVVRAPRLPRPGDAVVGAQVARAVGLVEQLLARPRPREPADGAEPPLRLRGVRRASASAAAVERRAAAKPDAAKPAPSRGRPP